MLPGATWLAAQKRSIKAKYGKINCTVGPINTAPKIVPSLIPIIVVKLEHHNEKQLLAQLKLNRKITLLCPFSIFLLELI